MKKLILGNWKMNISLGDSIKLGEAVRDLAGKEQLEIGVLPSFTDLAVVSEILKESAVALGAQDCFWKNKGAYTGEVSPTQLKDLRCKFVLAGHSERRRELNETDEMVNKKIKAACAAGLVPVLCLGETDDDRRKGRWSNVIADQTTKGLAGLELAGNQEIVIAYEPIWAIGTGRACAPSDAREAHALIMNAVFELFGAGAKKHFRIIYGGSVDATNVASYLAEKGIDGALVGGASQRPSAFAELIAAA